METVDINWYRPEETLGTEEYRVEVYDFEIAYEIDQYDIGKYDGKWYVMHASGCSCWGGEGSATGPFTFEDMREFVLKEYGVQVTDYYKPLVDAFDEAFSAVPSGMR